jgi:hypothetical protein
VVIKFLFSRPSYNCSNDVVILVFFFSYNFFVDSKFNFYCHVIIICMPIICILHSTK